MSKQEESDGEEMCKLGVETTQNESKTASSGCPACGGTLVQHGMSTVCVNCGTEPFEAHCGR